MLFDLDKRTAALGVGEFSAFSLGPREAGEGGGSGIWRAHLGTHWHNELRGRAVAEHASAAEFEVPIAGEIAHRGWVISLTGRIDQIIRPVTTLNLLGAAESATKRPSRASDGREVTTLREIKSVSRTLPADDAELRREYPEYFIQIASYVALARSGLLVGPSEVSPEVAEAAESNLASKPSAENSPRSLRPPVKGSAVAGELVFVEVGSGLAQTVTLSPGDEALFRAQLERITEFLYLRLRARERLRGLRYRPAFATPRPGQETTLAELTATFERRPVVLFEAPTGFGKTGVLLEFALGQLKSGHFDRALYLTSKSTGQLQVVRTLSAMSSAEPSNGAFESGKLKVESRSGSARESGEFVGEESPLSRAEPPKAAATPVAAWHVRNKSEHCVNTTFHCVRDNCAFLAGAAERWPTSGLARFYLDDRQARDLDALRAAGREARICPYEITRAALAFNDVWIGDYNYVFAPRNRGLFYEQPGFAAARTLLLIDEAHNLPSRVADAYSHDFTAADAFAVRDELHRVRPHATLVTSWDHWCHFLQHLRKCDALSAGDEDDARHLLEEIAKAVSSLSVDYAALGPYAADALWSVPSLVDDLRTSTLPLLWWAPTDRELVLTCLDAAAAIGATLREFGGVVLASATLTPTDGFAAACGLTDVGSVASPRNMVAISDEGAVTSPRKAGSGRRPDGQRADVAVETTAAAEGDTHTSPTAGKGNPERFGVLTKRDTKKLYKQLTSAAELLRVEEARDAATPALLRAHAPWRDGTYDIAFDTRVDTTFQHRSRFYPLTAETIRELQAAAKAPIAAFFPSYAYADAIREQLSQAANTFRVAIQPKVRDLAAQANWVNESLFAADALFLVLGSSFAESIDVLGGRITHAIVVGPALPEVNAVQRARLEEARRAGYDRDAAFRQVYQIPGMTKVNQALGRLVRAPGHHAAVVLHCRRFAEASYLQLLAPEYREGTMIADDADFAAWLNR